MARAQGDRDAAKAAVDGFRAYWPHADAELENARDVAAVEQWLAGAP